MLLVATSRLKVLLRRIATRLTASRSATESASEQRVIRIGRYKQGVQAQKQLCGKFGDLCRGAMQAGTELEVIGESTDRDVVA